MALDNQTGEATLQAFLNKWPVGGIDRMSIEQYAHLSDRDACFCWWLEYGSTNLGQIGNMPATKFGLWKYKNRKDYAETYESDNLYAWSGKFGNKRSEAFRRIISIVSEIANAAVDGDWERVQNIDFHAVVKWKIAFLYSHKRLVPIFTREGLLKVAAGLGGRFSEDARIVDLQQFILSKKPSDQSVIEYGDYLWSHYVEGKPFRNYFIVGTKYKDEYGNDSKDVFPEMLATNSAAIGFLYNHDLTKLVGAPIDEINDFVARHAEEEETEKSKLQSYFRILLHLKPGDIIAFKSKGGFGMLEIIAYAVVTERNGKVYEYRPEELGHHINVQFVELGISRRTGLNYAGTVHNVDSERKEHLIKIFGPFLQVDNIALGSEAEDNDLQVDGQKRKSEDGYERGPVAARMVRQLHNIIQNSFYRHLKKLHPKQTIIMEFGGRVDIMRDSGEECWFYEIKPFENVPACLREATGQLIEYAFRFYNSAKPINLVVVGPGELNGEAKSFLNHYQESLTLSLSYEQHVVPLRHEKSPTYRSA